MPKSFSYSALLVSLAAWNQNSIFSRALAVDVIAPRQSTSIRNRTRNFFIVVSPFL